MLVVISATYYKVANKRVAIRSEVKSFPQAKLSENDSNYYTTKDKNTKFIFENFGSKIGSSNLPLERKYLGERVLYYDASKYLLSSDGAVSSSFVLYNITNGEKINSECYIDTAEGYLEGDDLYVSVSPVHRNDDYLKQGLCIFRLGTNNFSYIDLSKDLKTGETFIKDINNNDFAKFPLYDYKVSEDAKKISISVFKDNKGESPNTMLRETEYVLP